MRDILIKIIVEELNNFTRRIEQVTRHHYLERTFFWSNQMPEHQSGFLKHNTGNCRIKQEKYTGISKGKTKKRMVFI